MAFETWVRATTGLTRDNTFYPVDVVEKALKEKEYETKIMAGELYFLLKEEEVNEFRRISESESGISIN